MDRRQYIALAGSSVTALAGCMTGNDEPPNSTTESPTPTPGGPVSASVGDTIVDTIAVTAVTAKQSVRYRTAPDALGVTNPDERQFIFATVDASGVEGEIPAKDMFSLSFTDQEFTPVESSGDIRLQNVLHDRTPYDPPWADDPPAVGFLMFDIPSSIEPESASIVMNANREINGISWAEWTLSSEHLDAITPPYPDLSVGAIATPDQPIDGSIPVTMHAQNSGEADGVLRAAVNHTGPLYGADTWDIPVSSGERVEDKYSISYDWGDASEIQFSIVWPDHNEQFSIQV